MKIAIKLKPPELYALLNVFEATISRDACDTAEYAIVNILITRFYKKLKERSILIERPVRMRVDAETALAFTVFFNDAVLDASSFAGNVVSRLMLLFRQKTASMYWYS